ncbi:MAG: aspartyl protease family protein [bacterium]
MAYLEFDSGGGSTRAIKTEAIIKVVSLFGFAIAIGIFFLIRGIFFKSAVNQVSVTDSFGKLEYSAPYKNTLYESFGFVQEPKITMPLKTTKGYVDTTFLLDSGAVVSTLPLQAAQDTGADLANAKRITLQGFSGVPAFAYLAKITIKIGNTEYELPATFTESNSTTYILGRKGLFDDYTINFNHEQRVITISKRS